MAEFTRHDVIAAACARYKKGVSIDLLDDAMMQDNLEDAVSMILLDSAMWDSVTGDPMDTTNIVQEEFSPFNTVNS